MADPSPSTAERKARKQSTQSEDADERFCWGVVREVVGFEVVA
jgi:hypothetical protein